MWCWCCRAADDRDDGGQHPRPRHKPRHLPHLQAGPCAVRPHAAPAGHAAEPHHAAARAQARQHAGLHRVRHGEELLGDYEDYSQEQGSRAEQEVEILSEIIGKTVNEPSLN